MATSTIGIIGSGNIGSGLARLSVASGLDVLIGNSRGPGSLASLVAELGDQAEADTVEGVAGRADIVVLALPLSAYRSLPAARLDGKVVIDAMNYYPKYTGTIEEIEQSGKFSSLFIQEFLAGAKVVKALNSIDFLRLVRSVRPTGSRQRSALPIAGDDAEAKHIVADFLSVVGFDSVDIGGLAEGWRFQPGTPLYVTPYSRDLPNPSEDPRTRFVEAETVEVSSADVRHLAAQAARA